jgi:hypothetical protein
MLVNFIKEIKYSPTKRGFPDIKLDEDWVYLGINGEEIYNIIFLDDSIVKIPGCREIKVFRKDSTCLWKELNIAKRHWRWQSFTE